MQVFANDLRCNGLAIVKKLVLLVSMIIDVIIPALNEEQSLPLVLGAIPRDLVRHVIVADNNSTDRTAEVATAHGAHVVKATTQGYGAACLSGIAYSRGCQPAPDILVFLDADYSDHPEELPFLTAPIIANESDLVIGSRVKALRERGAMLPQQVFGNRLATFLIRVLFRKKFYDLGPFRAIRFESLEKLNMRDTNYGWTVEMQIKAIKHNLRWKEIPVHYRKRKGVSKISGTVKGTFLAGYKIITTIIKYR